MIRVYVGATALKSASGFCAGVLPQYCEKVAKDACGTQTVGLSRSRVWTICGSPYHSETTAAYGKWVISWDSTIVSRIALGRIAFEPVSKAVSGFVPAGFEDAPVYYVENGLYAGDDEDASFEDLRDGAENDEISE